MRTPYLVLAVTGGALDKGHWVAPTIFAAVTDELRIAREEGTAEPADDLTDPTLEGALR